MTPKLLDLFAGAGGCSVGYRRAGFDVTGIDVKHHPDYPYRLIVADAMEVLRDPEFLTGFDVISASPPCPAYSTITRDKRDHPRLIGAVRLALLAWGGPYVIENVEGARRELDHPVKICGSSLGLGVRRHRYFESNHFLVGTPCAHNLAPRPLGVYGHSGGRGGRHHRPATLQTGRRAMGIDWMDWDDLTDAIPPAYTEHIGAQLLDSFTGWHA